MREKFNIYSYQEKQPVKGCTYHFGISMFKRWVGGGFLYSLRFKCGRRVIVLDMFKGTDLNLNPDPSPSKGEGKKVSEKEDEYHRRMEELKREAE